MKITDDLLEKICRLSHLELPEENRAQMKADFQRMLDFVDKLQELDIENIAPLIHPTEEVNHLRLDVASAPLSQEDVLRNAPKSDGTYFRVPKVVKK